MTCPHCKAQWHLPANNKAIKKSCPFCDGDLYTELSEPYTFESALKEIVSRFGVEILSEREELMSAFAKITHNLDKEIQGLRFFESCGGINSFLNAQGASQEEITAVYAKQINQTTAAITAIANSLLATIGMQIAVDTAEKNENDMPSSTTEWEYVNLGNNTIEIIACKNQLPSKIVFPSFIDGKKVVSIGSTVLGAAKTKGADRLRVESVCIPQGITAIGSSVFSGCKALKEVILPQGLSSIGDNAFQNCKALTNISIPDSVTYMGSGAFSGSSIQSIVLPGGIGSVPEDAFKNCKKLISATILEGVTSIKRTAFYECKAITSVSLPESLISIEGRAFYGCGALKNITLPNSIMVIGYGAFEMCHLTIEILPTSLKMIENSSFEWCHFTDLTIPDGVTKIEDYAFGHCWSLRKITIPKSVVKIEDDAFFDMSLEEITIVCYKDSYAHKWALKNKVKAELI